VTRAGTLTSLSIELGLSLTIAMPIDGETSLSGLDPAQAAWTCACSGTPN